MNKLAVLMISLSVSFVLLNIFNCSSNPASVTTGTIGGKVFNSAGDTAIAGAIVTTSPATSSVTTDAIGEYTITEVSPGQYTVTAAKGGYNPGTVSVMVTAGNKTPANIQLGILAGNNPPSTPALISPANGSTNQATSITLSWSCSDPDGDPLTYDIYFGKTNPPSAIVSSNQSATSVLQSGLDTSTTYYWKVIAKDSHGATTPGNVWSFTTMTGQGIPLEFSSWKCYSDDFSVTFNPAPGIYEKVANGLKIYGNGYRNGTRICPVPTSNYPIMNKTIYVKWQANGGGNYMGVGIGIFTDAVNWTPPSSTFMSLTTDHSYLGSYVITDNLWYYTRIILTTDSCTGTTSTGNYDDLGGTVVQTLTCTITSSYSAFTFGLGDNYSGTSAYAILGEAIIK